MFFLGTEIKRKRIPPGFCILCILNEIYFVAILFCLLAFSSDCNSRRNLSQLSNQIKLISPGFFLFSFIFFLICCQKAQHNFVLYLYSLISFMSLLVYDRFNLESETVQGKSKNSNILKWRTQQKTHNVNPR